MVTGPSRPVSRVRAAEHVAGSGVVELLNGYASVLRIMRSKRRRRRPVERLAIGTNRQLVEHVRRSLDTLERRYHQRAALDAGQGTEDAADARSIAEFSASLPPPPSRLQLVWPAVASLVLAQVVLGSGLPKLILSWLPWLPSAHGDPIGWSDGHPAGTSSLANALSELAKLDAASAGSAADLVLHSQFVVVCLMLVVVCLAGYIVVRPLANGLLAAEQILRSEGVSGQERAVFDRLGERIPSTRRLDTLARSLLAGGVLLIGIGVFPGYLSGIVLKSYPGGQGDSIAEWEGGLVEVSLSRALLRISITATVLGAARLAWVASDRARLRTRTRLAATGAAAAVAAIGLAAYARHDHTPPSAEVDLPRGQATLQAGNPTLRVELSCDEQCEVVGARLLGHRWNQSNTQDLSFTPDGQERVTGGSRGLVVAFVGAETIATLHRSSIPDFAAEHPPGFQPRSAVRLFLAPAQVAQIRNLAGAAPVRVPGGDREAILWDVLELTVDDRNGNHSRPWLLL